MTELLEKAVEAARALPAALQDEIARTMLILAREEAESVPLSAEERAAIAVSKSAAARGEFATEDEMRLIWAAHGL